MHNVTVVFCPYSRESPLFEELVKIHPGIRIYEAGSTLMQHLDGVGLMGFDRLNRWFFPKESKGLSIRLPKIYRGTQF